MKLLVVGAEGSLGQELVVRGLARGHSVTAFSRHPYRIALTDERLHLAQGDVLDPVAVAEAVDGSDAVLFTVGSRRRRGEVCVYSDGIKVVLAAMRAAGVGRIVAVSAAGVGDPDSPATPPFFRHVVVPLFARSEYEDMERMESLLEASDVAWTVVKPLWLRDRAPSKRVHVTSDPRIPRHWGIARADVAEIMLDAVESRKWVRARIWLSRGR